jgi:uncharacterized protein YndB with AHSA1/START domain
MNVHQKNLVSIVCNFKVQPEKVWQAWTDPNIVKKWFESNPGSRVVKADLNLGAGKYYEITFTDSDLKEHVCRGVYTEVQPFSKLVFTCIMKSERSPVSYITISLIPESYGTLMNFEHANLDPVMADFFMDGWKNSFKKLEKLLAN